MKIDRNILMTRIALLMAVTIAVGCAAKSKLLVNKTPVAEMNSGILYVPLTKTVLKHDTVPKKRNEAELQAYLTSQYKINYDHLFAPQFNKMNATIDKLADGNTALADIITAMRKRAIAHNDSTQKQMSYYIKQALASQAQSIKYQQESLLAKRDYDKDIRQQTKSNTTLAIICLISVVILAGLYAALWLRVNSIAKKIDKLNRTSNV